MTGGQSAQGRPGRQRDDPAEGRTAERSAEAGPAGAGSSEPGRTEPFEEYLELERELSLLFRRARAASGVLAREVHPELDAAAYGLLARLNDAGPQRATDLAAFFGLGKPTMSRQLRALEALGVVARAPDPADGRAWLVQLTEEGRTRFGRVRQARRQRYVERLATWERTEIAELARLLRRFNAEGTPDT